MIDDQVFATRLAQAIERKAQTAGSFLKLEQTTGLCRRKLKRFVAEHNSATPFTLTELSTLDQLLADAGGLAGLLHPVRLLSQLVDQGQGRVSFIVGSSTFTPASAGLHASGEYVSAFDLKSVTDLMRAVDRGGPAVQASILTADNTVNPSGQQKSDWYRSLNSTADPSAVVVCGHAAVCPAANVLLGQLLGYDPFKADQPPPLRFAFPRPQYPSTFACSVEQLLGKVGPDVRAFEYFGKRYQINRNTGFANGVLVVGHLANARPAICIAGTTAPLTTACTQLLIANAVNTDLPASDEALIFYVEAEVESEPAPAGRGRRVARDVRIVEIVRWRLSTRKRI